MWDHPKETHINRLSYFYDFDFYLTKIVLKKCLYTFSLVFLNLIVYLPIKLYKKTKIIKKLLMLNKFSVSK